MKKEIKSVDSKQTAKVIATTGAWFSLIFTVIGIIMLISGIATGSNVITLSGILYMLTPFWYFILVYVFSRLVYWIYNKVAEKIGGIMFDIEDVND